MNTITIELCAEDRARLDKILEGLAGLKPDCNACAQAAMAAAAEATAKQSHVLKPEDLPAHTFGAERYKDQNAPQEPAKADLEEMAFPPEEASPFPENKDEDKANEEEPAPAVTVADIQKKVVALAAAGKKDAVRDIVKAYADRVSLIPADKLAEVFKKLTALED